MNLKEEQKQYVPKLRLVNKFNITNSTLVSLRIVQHLLPVENHQQKFCTTANFGQTCLLYHKIQISLST